jgi:hypothetical protein
VMSLLMDTTSIRYTLLNFAILVIYVVDFPWW